MLEEARDAPGCRIFIGSENRMFALVGLVGDRRALSREPGRGGRRCRRDRPDAVELCPRGPHGRLHRQGPYEIDGMNENEDRLARRSGGNPPRNGRGFARSRRARPRCGARTAARGSEQQGALRRRRDPERAAAAGDGKAAGGDLCRRPQFARDMLAIKDHLERALNAVSDELRADKVASNFLAGIEATRARAGRGVQPPRHQPRRGARASSSTRTSTRR